MKTLLLSILIALSFDVKAQGQAPSTVHYSTDTLNVGDSLKINFTYTITPPSNNTIQIRLYNSSNGYNQYCLNQNYNSIYTGQPHCYNQGDGTIFFKVKIVPSMGEGDLKIIGYTNFIYAYVRPASQVGLKEYDPNSKIIDIKYYDIYGKEKPSFCEGLTIKVTQYSNGYIKKEKVFTP